MSEQLHQFSDGPYDVTEFEFSTENGKVVIEVNDGDLGRIVIESVEAIEEFREALDKAESFFKERERRKEEL